MKDIILVLIIILAVLAYEPSPAYELDNYGRPTNSAAASAYNSHGTAWDQQGKSYTRQGNAVNSSDGSTYTPYGSGGYSGSVDNRVNQAKQRFNSLFGN